MGVEADADRVLTHYFACLSRAYVGWRWAVTVARASRSRVVTVDEVVLLPGPEALQPPEWLPWSERLRPGDLGVGDVLPADEDDVRLEPGYVFDPGGRDGVDTFDSGDEEAAIAWELGLGRRRVLSPLGRDEAAERWYTGEHGPFAPIAQAAPAQCSTCGFFVPLAGSLRRVFGVCANEYSPGDGSVVSADHGCGAHSEAPAIAAALEIAPPILDELRYDVLTFAPAQHEPGSVDDGEPGEDLGHS